MVFEYGALHLHSVQIILDNRVNTICVCQDLAATEKTSYVVIEIKQHEISRKVIKYLYSVGADSKSPALIECFSHFGNTVLVFPYSKPRPLSDFYVGEKLTLQESEHICNNLVLNCITSGLPYQVLYLILKQRRINISAANEIFFDYYINFESFDESILEKDCVVECARILLEILQPHANDKKMVSYILLQKRVASSGYARFTEIYKDITIAAADSKKRGLIPRIADWFASNKDSFFKFILWVCVILLIIVILSIVCQLIFGDIPWLRFFIGCFRKIGTESMLQ